MEKDRVYAGIDLDALRFNMESMHKNIHKETKIAAVIKADAYGHGALRVAEEIEDLPYLWGYAVATADEAMALVSDGRKKPVLILGISFPKQYETIVEYGLRPTVCEYEAARALSGLAVQKGTRCRLHIKIDTGMSRIGFSVDEKSADEIAQIAALPNIDIEGIFSHFARSDERAKEPSHEQLRLFEQMIGMLEERNLSIPIRHCANSAAIVEMPEAGMNLVRAGITLYGLWPSEEVQRDIIPLRPVMTLKSRVSFVKTIKKGCSVSYGGTYVADSDRRIATIPVGYADGYARGLSNKGSVLIHGKRAKICGRVCMDQLMADVTDIADVRAGDTVTLLGRDGDEEITMEELGELSGRFNYEFACLITPRVPRIYTGGRKN